MKTVKVKVAVAVDPSGEWNAAGWSGESKKELMDVASEGVEEGEARYWLEAELPVPEAKTIKAKVSKKD